MTDTRVWPLPYTGFGADEPNLIGVYPNPVLGLTARGSIHQRELLIPLKLFSTPVRVDLLSPTRLSITENCRV